MGWVVMGVVSQLSSVLTAATEWAIAWKAIHHFLQMSDEQLKTFPEAVKADTSLQEKLNAAADTDAVVAIAKEAGFSISADEAQQKTSEISDAELEGAAGGRQGQNGAKRKKK